MTDDYRRIRVLWPDHLNMPRGKYLPARLADRGTRQCLTLFALGYDRDMVPAPGSMFLEGMPDFECTFDMTDIRPGWEDGVGVVVGDLQRHGEPLAIAPRTVLGRAVDAWESMGYTPKVGIEYEAYIMEPDGSGGWRPYDSPGSMVYGTGRFSDPVGIVDAVMATADRVGMRLESVNGEYDVGQFEFTLEYDDAMAAVDEAFLFKVMAREVAAEHGHLMTFMPRPINGMGGNGLHVNLSLSNSNGANALVDPDGDDGLSELMRQCIAGQLHYLEAMAALCAPTVNSYKRLKPAQLSGYWQNWGHDHRCTTVRVNPERDASTRMENRLADGAANPYAAVAAVLTAARLGVSHGMECPPAETGDGLENVDCEGHVPDDLGAALDALEADTTFVEAIGAEMVAQFLVAKRSEWDKFINHVTDWELSTYLPYL